MSRKSKITLYCSTFTIIALLGAAGLKWHMIKMSHQYHFAAPHHAWAAAQLLEMDVRLPETPLITKLVDRLVPTVYACTKPPCNGQQSHAVPLQNCGINLTCTEYTCASTTANRICSFDPTGNHWNGQQICQGCMGWATDQGCTPP